MEAAYRVCGEARDGIDAVDKVRQLRPDIVLMDINMPRMEGLQASQIIRREIPDCNVIIVTQNDARIAREQALIVDAKGFVEVRLSPRFDSDDGEGGNGK